MISNIPSFAMHQDYQARHADMLAAARRGKEPVCTVVECGSGGGSIVWKTVPNVSLISRMSKCRFIGWDLASERKNLEQRE